MIHKFCLKTQLSNENQQQNQSFFNQQIDYILKYGAVGVQKIACTLETLAVWLMKQETE